MNALKDKLQDPLIIKSFRYTIINRAYHMMTMTFFQQVCWFLPSRCQEARQEMWTVGKASMSDAESFSQAQTRNEVSGQL